MKTIAKIIDLYGGLERLRDNPIRLENPPLMRLAIEYIGEGPRGLPSVSVAHYYEQNGDLMRDPEIVFEVNEGEWSPVSFQQDNLGIYQEAAWLDDGRVMIAPKLVRDLKSFARMWDRNILDQGFLTVAEGGAR